MSYFPLVIKILFARLRGENDSHVCLFYLTTKGLSTQNLSEVCVQKCLGNNSLGFCVCLSHSGCGFGNCFGIFVLEISVVVLEGTATERLSQDKKDGPWKPS